MISLDGVLPLHERMPTALSIRTEAAAAETFRFCRRARPSRSAGEEGGYIGKGLQRGQVRLDRQLRSIPLPIDHAEEA